MRACWAIVGVLVVGAWAAAQPKAKDPTIDYGRLTLDGKYEPVPVVVDAKRVAAEKAALPGMRDLRGRKDMRRESLGSFDGPAGGTYQMAVSPTGSIVACGNEYQVALFDFTTGRQVRELRGFTLRKQGTFHSYMVFSHDGEWLAYCGDKEVVVLNVATGAIIKKLPCDTLIHQVAFDVETKALIVVQRDFGQSPLKVTVWNSRTWESQAIPVMGLAPKSFNMLSWSLSRSGVHLVVYEQNLFLPFEPVRADFEVWNLRTGKKLTAKTTLPKAYLTFRNDAKALYAVVPTKESNRSEIWEMDLVAGANKKLFGTHQPMSWPMLSMDGKYLYYEAAASKPGNYFPTHLVDLTTLECRWSQIMTPPRMLANSAGGTIFVRSIALGGEWALDLMHADEMANPAWAKQHAAFEKAREIGFEMFMYGNHIRARSWSLQFTKKTIAELADKMPGVTILELRDFNASPDDLAVALADCDKFPKLEEVDLRRVQINDAVLASLAKNTKIKRLVLSNPAVTAKGLAALQALPLESIEFLNGSNIDDDGVKALSGIKSLERVHLEAFKATDVGCAEFGQWTNLRELTLVGQNGADRLTGNIIKNLATCPKLAKLKLDYLSVGNDDLQLLAKTSTVVDLEIASPSIGKKPLFNEAGLDALRALPKLRRLALTGNSNLNGQTLKTLPLFDLEELSLRETGFKDEHVPGLTLFRKLKSLNLVNTPITEQAVTSLKKFKDLHTLHIPGKFTIPEAALNDLKQSLPQTRISH